MPRKRDGQHDIHIRVPEHDFRLLQAYCANGVERITATSIITTFLSLYIENYIKLEICLDLVLFILVLKELYKT